MTRDGALTMFRYWPVRGTDLHGVCLHVWHFIMSVLVFTHVVQIVGDHRYRLLFNVCHRLNKVLKREKHFTELYLDLYQHNT